MSNHRQTEAQLLGCEGPFFPSGIDELRVVLDEAGNYAGLWLAEVAATVDGFEQMIECPYTIDGYYWFAGMRFGRGDGTIVILVPGSHDWKERDGTKADRAIAVYTQGPVAGSAMAELTQNLADAVRKRHGSDLLSAVSLSFSAVEAAELVDAVDLRQLLTVSVDGVNVPISSGYVTGDSLTAGILDRSLWPSGSNIPLSASVMVFASTRAAYVSLESAVRLTEGVVTDVGKFTGLVGHSGDNLAVALTPDCYFDIFLVGDLEDATAQVIGWIRLATIPTHLDIPSMISMSEAKAVALLRLGVPISSGRRLPAEVQAMASMANDGWLQMAGFQFAPVPESPGQSYGIMVDHTGVAATYHGLPAEDIRRYMGL